MPERHYTAAFLKNREPIATVLKPLLEQTSRVLEIGSGRCNHAELFTERFPEVVWQPSEASDELFPIACEVVEELDRENLLAPRALDLMEEAWEVEGALELIVMINVLHIAPQEAGDRIFLHASRLLPEGGKLFVYGPFRYEDRPLEPSNVRFERYLQREDPRRMIRTVEVLKERAKVHGISLIEDVEMPSNNRALIWQKQ